MIAHRIGRRAGRRSGSESGRKLGWWLAAAPVCVSAPALALAFAVTHGRAGETVVTIGAATEGPTRDVGARQALAPQTTDAQPTGLWQFDGDFGAVIGRAMEPRGDLPFVFGRCSDWTLPPIGGSDERIVRLGRPDRPSTDSLLRLYTEAEPNGGGRRTNEYTLVMDVLFAAPFGQDGWTALLNLDGANQRFDTLWYRWSGATGTSPAPAPAHASGVVNSGLKSAASRSVPPDTWMRLAFRVSVRDGRLHEDFFVDGVNVSVKSADVSPVDGRGSAPALGGDHPFIAFWAHPYPRTNVQGTAFLNSLAFFGRPLSDEYLDALGGAGPGGMPETVSLPAPAGVTAGSDDGRGATRQGQAPSSSAASGPVTDSTLVPRPVLPGARTPVVRPPTIPAIWIDASADFVTAPIPGAVGAPYFATHDGSEAVLVDDGDVYVAYFGNGSHVVRRDARTGDWQGPIYLGGASRDPYRYPEIVMDRDGYLHAFYGGHDSAGEQNGFHYRRSVAPRDVSAWTPETVIGRDASFPKPYALSDGRLLLFSRGSGRTSPSTARPRATATGSATGRDGAMAGTAAARQVPPAHKPGWGYMQSIDRGRTWSPFRILVDAPNTLYGGGKLVEEPDGQVVIHWAWGWWDHGVCDLGQYYAPSIAVPCKYDDVEYAAFPIGADTYRDARGTTHALPFTRDATATLWNREWLIVADSALDLSGNPVIPIGDYAQRRHGRLLIATHTKTDGWIVEHPFPDMEVAFNNVRVQNIDGWITVVGLALGPKPGLFVAQRRNHQDPFYVRRITHQAFPFQMHPLFRHDPQNGLLHLVFAEGDRLSPSRLMHGSLPLDPLRRISPRVP